MNKMIGVLMLSILTMSSYAGGVLNVIQATHSGADLQTVNQCGRAEGYFFEIGKPTVLESRLAFNGHEAGMPLRQLIKNSATKDWTIKFGKRLPDPAINVLPGYQSWVSLLKQLAYEHHLAIIVDWNSKTVFVNNV